MFGIEQREPRGAAAAPIPFVDDQQQRSAPGDELERRHAVLMECLNDERDRQAEERMQAAIDEDFYDHRQWRREDAETLMARNQAPLCYNESRLTIDWIAGTQKRLRKDYKVLPREPGDEAGAEVKSKVVKYTDDVNLTAWHVSRAFKQAALSGLSWLEEGINLEPGCEIIYAGSEDWRHVYRDSRGKKFDQTDWRYLFRRKVTDLDYAQALLPKAREHLLQVASDETEPVDEDDVWFLGERLTGASDLDVTASMPARWSDRRAYIAGSRNDHGRRQSVELLECWYRVPATVRVFADGPLAGKVLDSADPRHAQIERDRWAVYEAVKMRMRVMVATKDRALWDGASPFRHDSFLLVPLWGYRRYSDGLTYGVMRGMRDLQEDSNKRASKAQWLLANNRIVMDSGAVEDIDELRDEAARPDGVVVKRVGSELRFEKAVAEVQGNLEMMDRNINAMRNIGGVTNENLGRDTNARSGIAIERKQDQGALSVSELFDNLLLARKMAGRLRLSHIEQFWTQHKAVRITGESQPIEWLEVNKVDPDSGKVMNDLTAREADVVVTEQDYRESFVRAAMAEMFALLGQIATFAPQVVLAVLDLAVEGAEIPNKAEWVGRIRKLNGQRDPSKPPTPEEQQEQQDDAEKAALQEELALRQMQASLAEVEARVAKLDTETIAKRIDALFAATQAALTVAQTPQVAPIADVIAQEAGFAAQRGDDPNLPQPPQAAEPIVMAPEMAPTSADTEPPPPQGLDGIHRGIETITGADNAPQQGV